MLYIVNAVEAAFYHIDTCIALSFMKIWSIVVFAHFKMSCMMHVIIFATFYGGCQSWPRVNVFGPDQTRPLCTFNC